MIAFVSLRIGTLVEILPAVPHGLGHASDAFLDAVLMGVALVGSLALCAVAVRRRRYPAGWWAWGDVSVAMAVLVAEPWYLRPEDWIGTWTAWGGALSVNAVFGAAIGFPALRQTAVAACAVAAAYAIPSVFLADAHAPTAASNLVGYAVFAVAARSSATFIRRLGRDADRAREQAAAAAGQAERDRHRLLLHDHATILRLLSEPGVEPGLVDALRRQAAAGAARVRSFLEQPDGPLTTAPQTLAALVRHTGEGFSDLPIDYAVDLAADVVIPAGVGTRVHEALATVLHNVRTHAAAGHVVVHADAPPGLGCWEVTVRDDGRGFDQSSRAPGFGLRVQVSRALAEVGVESEIRSSPGAGTVVLLRGKLENIDGDARADGGASAGGRR